MALTERALRDTREAFDSVAPDYDRSNMSNPTLRAMRRRVLDAVVREVAPGARVLDLGCGPGTDQEALSTAGYQVTAIDWSPAMVEAARRRVTAAGLGQRVTVHHLGIHQLERLAPAVFDAAYSNFGSLNCVPDLADAARQIACRLRSGGVLVASVVGRVCPWEMALFTWRGRLARAGVRFARDFVPVPLNGRIVWTKYYAPSEFEGAFRSAGFTRVSVRALGLFAPPPYLEGFAARHETVVRVLHRLDDVLGPWPPFRGWGDHFLMVLRKA